jgi:hypothetical protein
MIDFLFFLVMLFVAGFVTGVGALIHREAAWYRNFMQNHPVIGWTASFLVGGLVWLFASFTILYAMMLVLAILFHASIPIQ